MERYDPTIEDSYRKVVQVPLGKDDRGHQVWQKKALEILDTAGTDQFAAMRELYLRSGDAFLLVFSITSAASFHDLSLIYEEIMQVKNNSKVFGRCT